MKDKRERPWKKLRVIVEVTVPPHSRATEQDLLYHVEQVMPDVVRLHQENHDHAQDAADRLKCLTAFWAWFLRKERRLSIKKIRKERKDNDQFNGL